MRHYRISYLWGVWYITQNAPHVQQSPLGFPTQNSPLPLDFSIRVGEGTVVPQRRWTPGDELDIRQHVEGATLQLPVFFVNRNGAVGFLLSDILQGRIHYLHNYDSQASLGGRWTVHIRINVGQLSYLAENRFSSVVIDSFHSGLDMPIGDARYQHETRRIRGT